MLVLEKRGIAVDLNLEALKGEILDYLEGSEFAVFHSHAGGLEGLPLVTWDTERYPDYRVFLEVAGKVGQKLILFASREMDAAEIDEILEELEETELTREERRELEGRLRAARGMRVRSVAQSWPSITTRIFTCMRRVPTGMRTSSTPAMRSMPCFRRRRMRKRTDRTGWAGSTPTIKAGGRQRG